MSNVQSPRRIEPQTGGTLGPQQVVGRDRLVGETLAALRAGTNLLLTDPRRMGKTSFLSRLKWEAEKDKSTSVVIVDFEGVDTVDEFLRRLVDELRKQSGLWQQLKKVFAGWFENLDLDIGFGPLKVSAAFATRSRSSILEETIVELGELVARDNKMLFLLLDEVPVAISAISQHENPETAHVLLQALRRLRQRPDSGIRWLLTGSIGFHHVLRAISSTEGVVNDLRSLSCGPLDDDGARLLAEALLRGVDLTPNDPAVDALVRKTGGIPFLLHHLVHSLRGVAELTEATVAAEFHSFVEDRDASRPFTHLLSRIETYYGADARLHNAVLDGLIVESKTFADLAAIHGDVDREQLRRVVDLLIDDHYLISKQGRLAWRYEVLGKIWQHRRP